MSGTLRLESPDGAEVTGVPFTLRVLSSDGGQGSLLEGLLVAQEAGM